MATRKEVAAYAGVSVATVSNVVNGTKFVSEKVKKKVEDAIKILDYHPNMIARGLATKETRHVAIMVNNLKNGYYTEILEGAQSVASEYGYIVSIILLDYTNQMETLDMASRGLDGVFLTTVRAREVQKLMEQKICLTMDDLGIQVDYSTGIREAVHSLKQHGHTQIAFLSGLKLKDDGSHPRWDCFREACREEGLLVNQNLVVDANDRQSTDEKAGVESVQKLLQRKEKFSAVMMTNDLMAVGAIGELERNGYRVPEDVSVIGCDNSQMSKYYLPTISTLDVQVFELGRSIMHNMLCRIKDKPVKNKVILTRYIERESVADVIE